MYVVRAFVKLRALLASNRELARRFEQLEARVEKLVAHDQALGVILSAIRKLMPPPPEPPRTGRSDSPPILRTSRNTHGDGRATRRQATRAAVAPHRRLFAAIAIGKMSTCNGALAR